MQQMNSNKLGKVQYTDDRATCKAIKKKGAGFNSQAHVVYAKETEVWFHLRLDALSGTESLNTMLTPQLCEDHSGL